MFIWVNIHSFDIRSLSSYEVVFSLSMFVMLSTIEKVLCWELQYSLKERERNADFNSHCYKATYHNLSGFSYPLWLDVSVILTDVPIMNAFSLAVYWVLELWKCSWYCEVQSLPKGFSEWSWALGSGWGLHLFPQSVAFVVCGLLFCFVFTSPAPKGGWCFFQQPSVFLGMSPSLFCQSTGMKLLSACGVLTAALGCTDIWKYFSRFRNSQFSLLHLK